MKIHNWRPLARAILLGLGLLHFASAAEAVRSYTVVLSDPAVGRQIPPRLRSRGERLDWQRAAVRAGLQDLEHKVALSQDAVKAAIAQEGAEVVGSVSHVLNAVFIRATKDQVSRVQRLGGVERVVRNARFKLLLDHAGEIVRAPAAWTVLGGIENAGAGLRIGILDSGFDLTHAALQDSSLSPPPGFPKGPPEDLPFTNAKVIVARSYVNLLNPENPAFSRPDDVSPRDRVGHGTAVATIAAGRRVEAPGATVTGIAPKAFLGNYKIFGSPGINEFSDASAVIAAIDDAVTDGMDIISISFGAIAQFPFDEQGDACSSDPNALCDPAAMAAQSAVEDFGVVVVAAAGNAADFGEQSFPAYNTIATPASAPAVIAVGATVNSRQFVQRVLFEGVTATAISGTGPKPQAPLNREAIDAGRVGDSFGCDPFATGTLAGLIVVIARGDCDFEVKVANAAGAGAAAVVVTNIDGDDEPFPMFGLETTDIPAFMIGDSDGDALRSRLGGAARIFVTLDPTLTPRSFAFDQLAPFSSRGPTPANDIKPDLVAPGSFIYTAAQRLDPNGDTFDPTGFASVDGTSFSAPIVAGAAALVMQRHPDFTVAEVKSALVNTAGHDVIENGQVARVNAVGAGLLDIPVALDPVATVTPATLSFGAVAGALPIERTLTLRNALNTQQTYRVGVEQRDPDSNAAVRVQGGAALDVTLNAGETSNLTVSLQGTPPAAGSYEGFIHVTALSGGVDLGVPYYYVVGDRVPFNSFVIAGTGVVGTVGEPHPELLIFRVIDQFGQPVPNLGVSFRVVQGGGTIVSADSSTDAFGIAAADPDMGPTVGFQDFEAQAGNLVIPFFNAARAKPWISGVVNGASFASGQPMAPGSIISIFGEFLNEFPGGVSRLPLPIAFKHVSVSFDFPERGISVPGRLFFDSDKQLNVQVPWALAGLNFSLLKVRIDDSVSDIFAVDLADYAPGIFEINASGTPYGALTHADGTLVSPNSPASGGETVVVYATGVGPLDSRPASGEAAPTDRLVRTVNTPLVTVAGQEGVVKFSGLSPGYVGLYQVNVTLPASLPSGNQQLRIISNGIASNTVVVPIR